MKRHEVLTHLYHGPFWQCKVFISHQQCFVNRVLCVLRLSKMLSCVPYQTKLKKKNLKRFVSSNFWSLPQHQQSSFLDSDVSDRIALTFFKEKSKIKRWLSKNVENHSYQVFTAFRRLTVYSVPFSFSVHPSSFWDLALPCLDVHALCCWLVGCLRRC